MRLSERIDYLSKESNIKDSYWYVVKQEWDFSKLCYAVKILEKYKQDKSGANIKLEEFFENNLIEMGVIDTKSQEKLNHRCLMNAEYLGLVRGDTSLNKDKIIQKIFYDIENRVDGNFKNIEMYYDLFEQQAEKMYLQHRRDDKALRNKFELHPLFVLYKVLLLVGYSTDIYSISLAEFKVFVCFIEKYSDVYTAADHIINSRVLFKQEVKTISKKIDNMRIHNVFKQLKTLEVGKNYIQVNNNHLSEIEKKIDEYERVVLSRVNKKNMDKALYSDKKIFDFYSGGNNYE